MATKYEVQDTSLQVVIGTIAIIVTNILNYFGIYQIFFGNADTLVAIQCLTVTLMALITFVITRRARKKKERKVNSNAKINQDTTDQVGGLARSELAKKELKTSEIPDLVPFQICNTHFHFPEINNLLNI